MKKYLSYILILFCVLFLFTGCAKKKEEEKKKEASEAPQIIKTIKIGILTDLSGSLVTEGTGIRNTALIAKDFLNQYFKEKGYPYSVEIYVEDTQVNPSLCLKKVQALKAKGVNVVVGPMASSEVKNIASYVTANKIIIISPSSAALPNLIGFTTPAQKKYVFRFVPDDSFQGQVIADEINSLGIKNVIVLFREDAWGKGLAQASVENIKKLGINIISEIGYPSTPEPSDWSPYIQKMGNLLKGKSPKDTAILAISFEELATLLSQISDNSPLLSYKWFGASGVVNSQKVIEEAKEKAVKVRLYSTVFYSVSNEAEKLLHEYKKRGYGEEVTQFSLNSYDGVWVLGLAYAEMLKENNDKYDADLLVKKIHEVVKKYSNGDYGVKPVTGPIILNEWNDRASGNYAIRVVTPEGWKLGGIWYSDTRQIEWFIK